MCVTESRGWYSVSVATFLEIVSIQPAAITFSSTENQLLISRAMINDILLAGNKNIENKNNITYSKNKNDITYSKNKNDATYS